MRAYSVRVWRVTACPEPLCARMGPIVDMETGTLASPADPRENTRGLALTCRCLGGNSADQRFGR